MSIADLMSGKGSSPESQAAPSAHGMNDVMSIAYKLDDSQLADILSGKSLTAMYDGKPIAIPQFAAMAAAMGKKELRTAVEGKIAQQQLMQQQSMKDKMLADLRNHQGLPPQGIPQAAQQPQAMPQGQPQPGPQGVAGLPADNMKSMAGGGIIAFDDGGEVKHFWGGGPSAADVTSRWQALSDDDTHPWTAEDVRAGLGKVWDPIQGFLTNRYNKERIAAKQLADTKAFTDTGMPDTGAPAAYPVTTTDGNILPPGANPAAPNAAAPTAAPTDVPAANPAKPDADTVGIGALTSKRGNTVDDQIDRVNKYLKAIKGDDELEPYKKMLEDQKTELKQQKEQAGGEAIMGLGIGLLGHAHLNDALAAGGQNALNIMQNAQSQYNKGIQGLTKDQMMIAKDQTTARKADLATAIGLENSGRQADLTQQQIDELRQYHQMQAPYWQNRGNAGQTMTLKDATVAFNKLTPQQLRLLPPYVKDAVAYHNYINGGEPQLMDTPGADARVLKSGK